MREVFFINKLQELEQKIERGNRRGQGVDQEVITLRLQMNAMVNIIRWLFPFNLLFKYFVKKEFKIYKEQLETRRKEIQDMKKQMATQKQVKNPEKKIGRNEKCRCGSDKKYKKCCMGLDQEVERAKHPEDAKRERSLINAKLNNNKEINKKVE